MSFGEKLALLRKQRGMTQLELAEELDISRQAVSRWEQGVSEPSTENLIRIGKLFGVPVDALVNGGAQSPPETDAQAAEAKPEEAEPENVNQEADQKATTPEEAGDPPQVIPPKPRRRRAAAVCAGLVCALLGMLAGVMLMGCGTAALAATGGVTFGTAGLTINGRTVIQAGEATTNDNGCEIPSTIIYTDEQGGGNTYLPIRAVSELLDIPVAWEDGVVYLGYKPNPSSGFDIIIGDSVFTPELLDERPLHRAGAKAGPYTELEPHWPSEDEIEGWNNVTLKDVSMSDNYVVGGTYQPLEDEGYCALSITNTTGRDLVLAVSIPATITTDNFPSTVVPAGETVVRTFYAAPYTGGLSQRRLSFTLTCDPVVVDGKVDKTVSATVSLVSFTPQ